MSGDFELGGQDEMDPTSSVTFLTSLREVWDAEQASICVYKTYTFILCLNDRSFR